MKSNRFQSSSIEGKKLFCLKFIELCQLWNTVKQFHNYFIDFMYIIHVILNTWYIVV